MLLAQSSGGDLFGWIVVLGIMWMGAMKWGKILKGNDAVRGAAKNGILHVIGKIFRK